MQLSWYLLLACQIHKLNAKTKIRQGKDLENTKLRRDRQQGKLNKKEHLARPTVLMID